MPEQFEYFVNNKPFTTSDHTLTGAEILKRAGLDETYELYVETGKESKPVGRDEVVHIHNKQRFRAIPPPTFGRHLAPSQT